MPEINEQQLSPREELHEPPMMRLGAPDVYRIVCPCGWESSERGNEAKDSMLLEYATHAYNMAKSERDVARAKMMDFAQVAGVVSFDA